MQHRKLEMFPVLHMNTLLLLKAAISWEKFTTLLLERNWLSVEYCFLDIHGMLKSIILGKPKNFICLSQRAD